MKRTELQSETATAPAVTGPIPRYGAQALELGIRSRRSLEFEAEPLDRVRIFETILRVASGESSKSELLSYGANEFVPWQIGATI